MAPKQLSAKTRRTHKQLHLLQASGSAIWRKCLELIDGIFASDDWQSQLEPNHKLLDAVAEVDLKKLSHFDCSYERCTKCKATFPLRYGPKARIYHLRASQRPLLIMKWFKTLMSSQLQMQNIETQL